MLTLKELRLTETSVTNLVDGETIDGLVRTNEPPTEIANAFATNALEVIYLKFIYDNIGVAKFNGRIIYNEESVGIEVENIISNPDSIPIPFHSFEDLCGNVASVLSLPDDSFIMVDEDDGDEDNDTNIYYLVSKIS